MIPRELIFRVFVSSTFSDLVAERNALQEHVFPRLREFCQKHGARFQAIDLRWGISNEAALDQSTMRICRAEIACCQAVTPRPNFVVLLGDRHGWRPLPDEIPAAEFEALSPHLPAELANRWYKFDENAVCPLPSGTGLDKGQYVLQPRTGEFTDYDRWFDEVEGPLVDAFHRAARELSLPEAARRKYEASATAQEIHDGVFAVQEAREHVVAFIREIRTGDGRPLREALPHDAAVKDFVDLKKGTYELDRESQGQLDALKQRLRDRLGADRIKTYIARWEGTGASTEHLPRLCVGMYRSLRRMIHAQIERHRAMPPLEEERLRHQEFAEHRARDFIGQAGPLAEIEHYLSPTAEPTEPLLVHGVSGSGKSALLAKTVADHPSRYAHHKLVFRFIGATANSTDPRSLLEGLCRELGEHYGTDNTDLPLDLNKLTVVFRQRLELATVEHPLALFLDALDQLQVADRPELYWLPDKLPVHVRLVVSAIPGLILDSLRSHLPLARLLELGPMRPEDAAELLQKWLQRAGRRLTSEEQRQAIRDGFAQCSLPLYLRLALEEAQRWHSYDQPPPPSPDVDGLIERLFHHLSEQLHHEPLLIERAISYLRCSRYGLTEDEIVDLLARDDEYWKKFLASAHHALPVVGGQQTRRLPIIIWSRLYHDLEPYLSWRSADGTALIVFFHSCFNEVADRQFLHNDTVRLARHDVLATYFVASAKGDVVTREWETRAVRGFAQCVFHLTKAGTHEQAAGLLSNFPFLLHKLRVGLLEVVFEDYDMVRMVRRRELPAEVVRQLEIWATFFREKSHILRRGNEEWPAYKILLQIAVEHADDSPVTIAAEQWLVEGRCDWFWLRRAGGRPKHLPLNPCLHIFEDSWGLKGAKVLGNGQTLSWGRDTLRLWDMQSGQCVVTFRHPSQVTDVLVLSDDRVLSWGSDEWSESKDKTLRIWDSNSGTCLAVLKGHTRNVTCALELQDGRILSWSKGRTLRIWDANSGVLLHTLEGHADKVNGALVLADGKILSWSDDHTLRLWDAQTGMLLYSCDHEDKVKGALILKRGRILSWSDKSFRLWHTQIDDFLCGFAVAAGSAKGVQLLNDGRILSWWSDGILRVWDGHLEPPQTLVQLTTEGQRYAFVDTGAQESADGRILSWTSDAVFRLWDAQSCALLRTIKCPLDDISGVRVLADDGVLAWDKYGTLQLWDVQSGTLLGTLIGHTRVLGGVQELGDGQVLSWSEDGTLRLWDTRRSGPCGSFEGHRDNVVGARVLADGRIISWSEDDTLRLWEGQSGTCLLTLNGHTNHVEGAMELVNGQILSWSQDKTLRLWDGRSGKCLEIIPVEELQASHPDLAALRDQDEQGRAIYARAIDRAVNLSYGHPNPLVASWQAGCLCFFLDLASDGSVIVTQDDFQVCVLHLFLGHRRLTLAECERAFPTLNEICRVPMMPFTYRGIRPPTIIAVSTDTSVLMDLLLLGYGYARQAGEEEYVPPLSEQCDGEKIRCLQHNTALQKDISYSLPMPHPGARGASQEEYQANLSYQVEFNAWQALPWWQRLFTPRPVSTLEKRLKQVK